MSYTSDQYFVPQVMVVVSLTLATAAVFRRTAAGAESEV